jgi:hypothetical protein
MVARCLIDTPPLPTSKEQCKDGGWRNFTRFKFMKVNTAVVGDVAVPAPSSAPSTCKHVTGPERVNAPGIPEATRVNDAVPLGFCPEVRSGHRW